MTTQANSSVTRPGDSILSAPARGGRGGGASAAGTSTTPSGASNTPPQTGFTGYEIRHGAPGIARQGSDVAVTAQCSQGRVAIGGGFIIDDDQGSLRRAAIEDGGYGVQIRNMRVIGDDIRLEPIVICTDPPAGYTLVDEAAHVRITALQTGSVTASCAPPLAMLGGGSWSNDAAVRLGSSAPAEDGASWRGYLRGDFVGPAESRIWARAACAANGSDYALQPVSSGQSLIAGQSEAFITKDCPAGKVALSGGVASDNSMTHVIRSHPSPDGRTWTAQIYNPLATFEPAIHAHVVVICAVAQGATN
jgi:hypothetical protein